MINALAAALPRKLSAPLIGLVSAFALGACASTGGPLGVSEAQEKQIGEQQHPQIVAAFGGEIDDPELTAYVQRVFDRLVANSEQPDAELKLTLLDSPVVNAMALPGHVYITRGLLALANNEAELAGVLGHEIGHIFERHTAKRISRNNLAGLGAAAAAILTGDPNTAQAAGQVAQLYVLNYSRENEYEADLVGVKLLARSGYDPISEADFLNTLGRWSTLQSQITGRQAPPEYLSSHPNSAARVKRAAEAAKVLTPEDGGRADRNRAVYLDQINGIVYGDDPQTQGFVRGNDFIHPSAGFAFTVPNGFEIRNTSQAVLARNESGAQMQFTGAGWEDTPNALIAGPISKSLGVDLKPTQSIRVDGRDAAIGTARAQAQSGPVDVIVYAVQWEGTSHFAFIWAMPASQTSALQDSVNRSVRSLREVAPGSVDVPATRKVSIATVQAGDTTEKFGQQMNVETRPEDHFIVINALGTDTAFNAGKRIKVIK